MSNGKGKAPEKGRNLPKFRDGYDGINWRKKPCTTPTSQRKTNTKIPVIQRPDRIKHVTTL